LKVKRVRVSHVWMQLLLLLFDNLANRWQHSGGQIHANWNMTKKLMSPFHLFVRPEARTILKWFLGKSKDSGKSTGTHGLLLWYGEDDYISISNEVLYLQGSDRFANLPTEGSMVAASPWELIYDQKSWCLIFIFLCGQMPVQF